MRDYIASERFKKETRLKGDEGGLANVMASKGELKLNYDDTITRDAAGTFAAGSGNCLSLVIMSAAFAKALKLDITYQNVRLDPDWSRSNGLYVASTHVNLSLTPPRVGVGTSNPNLNQTNSLTIDFVPSEQAAKYRTEKLAEKTIVAMYLNNRAAEELGQQRIDNAYWWARASLEKDPAFIAAYNTLGVIYQKRGDHQRAETVFKRALAHAPGDTIVMHNLVQALARQGKTAESELLARERARLEPAPPFYYFERGITAMESNRYSEAKLLFEREVQRAPQYHEFHYWLAMAHLWLGQPAQAREQLALAVNNSTSAHATQRYSSKLAHLRAAGGGSAP
jgi:Tfp pilus assembly protein PilF